MRPLDPAIKTVWTIKLALGWAVLVLAALTYDVLQFFDPNRWAPFGVLTGLVLLVGIALGLTLPRLRYRFWRFDLRQEELYLERGVWNRVRTIVPLRRIQHLDVSQDVLERNYGLGKLIVHTDEQLRPQPLGAFRRADGVGAARRDSIGANAAPSALSLLALRPAPGRTLPRTRRLEPGADHRTAAAHSTPGRVAGCVGAQLWAG